MAPEQLSGAHVDRRCDLFGVGVMLWEALAGERLFRCEDAVRTMDAVFKREPAPLLGRIAGVTPEVDAILARSLAKNAEARFATADEMARALEATIPPASDREVAEWVEHIAGRELVDRAAQVASFEREANTESGAGVPSRTLGSVGGSVDVDMTKGGGPAPSSRNALVPPPLEDDIRDRAPTLSSMREGLAALPANDATDDEPLVQPLRTPMEMIAPAGDETRAQPAFVRPVKRSDPIPMPLPPLDVANRASMIRIALLVAVPPIAALIAVLVFRPTGEPARINAATEPPPAFVDPPPPHATAPPVVTAPPTPAPTPSPTMTTSAPKPAAKPAPPRVPVRVWRPTPRPPRPR